MESMNKLSEVNYPDADVLCRSDDYCCFTTCTEKDLG